jgi:hypothetical protein
MLAKFNKKRSKLDYFFKRLATIIKQREDQPEDFYEKDKTSQNSIRDLIENKDMKAYLEIFLDKCPIIFENFEDYRKELTNH